MKTKIDGMISVKQNYGNHPCDSKFCSCDWIMLPPAYPTDFWDCTNPDCGKSKPPTANETRRMKNRKN